MTNNIPEKKDLSNTIIKARPVLDILTDPNIGWEDKGEYYYLPYDRLKEGLKLVSRRFLTGSRHAGALGLVQSPTPEEVRDYLLYGKKTPISDPIAVDMGNKLEPLLFEWYNSNIQPLSHAGAAVSKDTLWLLDIADGKIMNSSLGVSNSVRGVVEFKVTKYLPRYLADGKIQIRHHVQTQDHIHSYHAEWCDLLCYSYMRGDLFYRRLYKDQTFWDTVIMPGSIKFMLWMRDTKSVSDRSSATSGTSVNSTQAKEHESTEPTEVLAASTDSSTSHTGGGTDSEKQSS